MFSLRAFGLCSSLRTLRPTAANTRHAATKATPTRCLSSLLRQTSSQHVWRRIHARAQSTQASKGAKTGDYKYPALLNVFRIGTYSTALLGVFRAATVLIAAGGYLYLLPAYVYGYFYPLEGHTVAWYMPIAIFICSPVPMVCALYAFGPLLHSIHVRLPTTARKSTEDLMKFARNVPPQTELKFSYIRFAPWPTTKNIPFDELWRLPLATTRLTNLEHRPNRNAKQVQDGLASAAQEGMVRKYLGRYRVNRTQRTDKSGAPGVWDEMWEQIPIQGDDAVAKLRARAWQKREAKPPAPRIIPKRPKS